MGKKKYWTIIFSVLVLAILIENGRVSAHPLSAAFSTLTIGEKQTEFTFSIDQLSVIEGIGGDKNEDDLLDKEELSAIQMRVEEWIEDSVVLEVDGVQQAGEAAEPIVETKGNRDLVSFHFTYPGYKSGQTIRLLDGIFTDGQNASYYTDFYQVTYDGQVTEGVLQGGSREWQMLLAPSQQEQQQPDNSAGTAERVKKEPFAHVSWTSFLTLGMKHILTGYDHLLFLFALLLRKQTFKQYAALVTAFTLAHSITLTLAVLGIFDLPSKWIEAAIAFSICYVAIENIVRKEMKFRWLLTFFFGLIHGLGFAGILQSMEISKSSLTISLACFNIGIEIIQLAIVLVLLPVLYWLHRQYFGRTVVAAGSIFALVLGAVWLFQRLVI